MFASGELLDPQNTIREVHHHIAGYGPLQVFFDDPEVEEIWINEPSRVFIAKNGKSQLTNVVLTDQQVRDLVERMLRTSGRRLDLSQPFVDAVLRDGSRLHVVIPDITQNHWSINIRRFVVRPRSVYDLVELGTLTHHAAQFLEAAVVSGVNMVVAGGTQAGKTTLLNSLLGCVGAQERIISCEEVFEIRINHTDCTNIQYNVLSFPHDIQASSESKGRHLCSYFPGQGGRGTRCPKTGRRVQGSVREKRLGGR